MIRTTVYLILLMIYSGYGKVLIKDDKLLSDVTNNFLHKVGTKEVLEIPVYKANLSDISSNKILHGETKYNEETKKNLIEDGDLSKPLDTQKKCNDILNNEIESDEIDSCIEPSKIDNGSALILTPFIENGKIVEARNACKVNASVFLGVESYSGFLTVNKTYDSNMFFWYIPVEDKPVNETPWIVWLQGGPGVSSLIGMFDEIGPFKVNKSNVLSRNPYSWLQNHSLVFIDNPVGSGYSFTKHVDGFTTDMPTYAYQLHTALQQIIQIFPELRMAPLYIAGESYAGKYVPALAMEIHKRKGVPGSYVNLQGLMIGNAYIDPSMVAQVTRPFYYFGLLNKEQLNMVDPLLKAFQHDVATNNSVAAKNKWGNLIYILLSLSHQQQAYNFLKDGLTIGSFLNFLKRSEVKRALHVGDIRFSFLNVTVNKKMSPDFLSSSKHLYEQLLEHYRVLAYCGQLDQMMSCMTTSEQYRTWEWDGAKEFLEATRYPYIFNTKLAGYHKTGGRLTEVLIRGAGHLVPEDKPEPIQNLVASWTHNQPLSHRFKGLERPFVQEFVKNSTVIYFK